MIRTTAMEQGPDGCSPAETKINDRRFQSKGGGSGQGVTHNSPFFSSSAPIRFQSSSDLNNQAPDFMRTPSWDLTSTMNLMGLCRLTAELLTWLLLQLERLRFPQLP
jgi:hypothetical protein